MKLSHNTVVSLKGENLVVEVLPLGASLISMKYNNSPNVVVRYNDLNDYKNNGVYLGTMVGPIAGRTKDAQFTIDGKTTRLSQNDNNNHLHGGYHGISTHVFNISYQSDSQVIFEDEISHQKDGYPGTVTYRIKYEVVDDELVLEVQAKSSSLLPLNITNHTYFNLEGSNSLSNQKLRIKADKVAFCDDSNANTGEFLNVKDTVFDFNNIKELSPNDKHPQFEITRYLDHDFKLNGNVTLESPEYILEIETDMPYMRVYSANWFDESFVNEHGEKAKNQSAVAFEPQYLANGYNITNSKEYLFNEVGPFKSRTTYKLIQK